MQLKKSINNSQMHRLLPYLILGFLLLSCSPSKLETSKKDDNPTYFEEFNDYLLFTFRTHIVVKKDLEIHEPTLFDIELPKKIGYWEVINSSNFGFYYKQDQVIFINTLSSKGLVKSDTVYVPLKDEIETLINDNFTTSGNHKWDIKEIPIIPGRKNLLIIRGETNIFLFNIKENNFDSYLNLAKSYNKTE
jgi:hypothetical protein